MSPDPRPPDARCTSHPPRRAERPVRSRGPVVSCGPGRYLRITELPALSVSPCRDCGTSRNPMTCPIPSREGVEVARTAALRRGRDPLARPEPPGVGLGAAARNGTLRRGRDPQARPEPPGDGLGAAARSTDLRLVLWRCERGMLRRDRWGEHEGRCGYRDDDHEPKPGARRARIHGDPSISGRTRAPGQGGRTRHWPRATVGRPHGTQRWREPTAPMPPPESAEHTRVGVTQRV